MLGQECTFSNRSSIKRRRE